MICDKVIFPAQIYHPESPGDHIGYRVRIRRVSTADSGFFDNFSNRIIIDFLGFRMFRVPVVPVGAGQIPHSGMYYVDVFQRDNVIQIINGRYALHIYHDHGIIITPVQIIFHTHSMHSEVGCPAVKANSPFTNRREFYPVDDILAGLRIFYHGGKYPAEPAVHIVGNHIGITAGSS